MLCVVPYTFLPPTNGGGYGIYFQHKNLSKHAQLFVAGTEENQFNESSQGEPVLKFSSSRFRYINPLLIFKINRVISQHQIQVIKLDHPYMAWLLIPLLRFKKIPLIIRSHNIEYNRFRDLGKKWWTIMKWYELWAYKNAHQVWFVTKEDRKEIENRLGENENKFIDFPYGTELTEAPTDRTLYRNQILSKHDIPSSAKILLFNGALNYKPNRDGLDRILHTLLPILEQQEMDFRILICGSKLPPEYNNLSAYKSRRIIYAGFVDHVDHYFKAADVFMNPVLGGGGVKTKLVDAIAFGTPSVSTANGAIGLYTNTTGDMLHVVEDNDWNQFAETVLLTMKKNIPPSTPQSFYAYYNWESNAKRINLVLPMIQTIFISGCEIRAHQTSSLI
jgi:polysaccharide biosynthesis protein PslH